MSTAIQSLPAPAIGAIVASGGWQREHEAFLRLKAQLLATHEGQYVAIYNEQVVASGSDEVALALDFFAKHGNVPVHIGLVAVGTDPVARIPHYREVNPRGVA